MYKGKKIIAVIPARGGSKGIPDKNIKMLAGKPLIAWTIQEAKKSKYIDRLILSSESKKIIDIALSFGCEVPFVRPLELAGDNVLGVEPLIHAVKTLPEKYDYAVLLQCTSPLRTAEDIDKVVSFCIGKGSNSCISVCKTNSSPYKMQTITEEGRLRPFIDSDKAFYPRQHLPKVYEQNGAFYMIKTETLLKTKNLFTDDTLAYIMDSDNSLDVDRLIDFDIAEVLIKGKVKEKETSL